MTARILASAMLATALSVAIPTDVLAARWAACMRFCYAAYDKKNPNPQSQKPPKDYLESLLPPLPEKPDGGWAWERFKACKKECHPVR